MAGRAKPDDPIARVLAHSEPVSASRFVDAERAALLGKMGIRTIGDLIRHYPSRYIDLSSVASLAEVKVGADATVVGVVHEIKVRTPKPRLNITEIAIVDGTGVLIGVWFNQGWVAQRFRVGERVAFAGRIEHEFGFKRIKTPFVERLPDEDDPQNAGRVLPVHRTTDGLTTAWLRRLVAAAVDDCADVPDHLPADLRVSRSLIPISSAMRDIHFPRCMEDAREARRRLAYDELLSLQLYMAMRRHHLTRERSGHAHAVSGPMLEALERNIGVTPTDDQRNATAEILGDMASGHPMNRLLLGDVGTGKTLVATYALVSAAQSGTQAAMMGPTEVLARQYAEKIGPLLDTIGVSWALLTGSTTQVRRTEILSGAADGSINVLFGTHALLEQSVVFARLTLAIVDEQHRFGVNQRLGLRSKGEAADLLVMTATPIPRSLALTLYGDLATSYLRQRPISTAGVTTHLVPPHRGHVAHDAVRAAVAQGRQAYVVCALVDESDSAKAKAAVREAERLRDQVFPELHVGLLTGRMRSADKLEAMRAFRAREIDVLVSTTVIEVGVDVPNATQMLIEDADRFGLAQLHQLRGRVGRGEHPGEVWLIAEPRSAEAKERLGVLVQTSDGFELAERDMRLRGEGEVMGERQHGLPELRIASLLEDLDLVTQARTDAFRIVGADPHLTDERNAPLLMWVRDRFAQVWEWVSAG